MWITIAIQADLMLLARQHRPQPAHINKSLIIGHEDQGRADRSHLDKLGMPSSSETAQMFFDDVRVPQG